MKTIKFEPKFVSDILSGRKTSTWRLFDDKDLQENDELVFINKETGQEFANAVILEIKKIELDLVSDAEIKNHGYLSNAEMYESFRKYYGLRVIPTSILKIVSFKQVRMVKNTTSAGGVVINRSTGKVLVVSQRGNSWSLPKGHVEQGEDVLTAAKREVSEESGIDQLEFVRELGSYQRYKISQNSAEDDQSELKTIVMFLFKTEQTLLKPTDPDNPEARWLEKGEVARLLTHPKDKEFFEKIKDEITV